MKNIKYALVPIDQDSVMPMTLHSEWTAYAAVRSTFDKTIGRVREVSACRRQITEMEMKRILVASPMLPLGNRGRMIRLRMFPPTPRKAIMEDRKIVRRASASNGPTTGGKFVVFIFESWRQDC